MQPRVPFSQRPGRHERHFLRKLDNSLFPRSISEYEDEQLLEVQKLDHEELLEYLTELRALVQKAVDLKPNEESQVILDLKSDLEQAYEKACTLADEQADNKAALKQLINVIMNTVHQAAGNDAKALGELQDEALARERHFELLESSLVADLLDPDTLIKEDELIPVLLSEPIENVTAALELFDPEQRSLLANKAAELVAAFDAPDAAWQERIKLLAQQA